MVLARRSWQVSLLVFAALRVVAVWARPTTRFADSVGYDKLDFLGRADRFWPVTFVYWLARNDTARIAVQTSTQILAFALLATAVVVTCGQRLWTGLPILVIACTPEVTRFDLTILSESLGISFLAMALGSCLLLLRRQSAGNIVLTIASITLFAMTRPPQMMFLAVACVAAVIYALRSRTRWAAVSAAVLAVMSVWGVVQLHNNEPMSTLVYYTVLNDRIVRNNDASRWFASHGMPLNSNISATNGYLYQWEVPKNLLDYVNLPAGQKPPKLMGVGGFDFARWVKREGWKTYAQYVVARPRNAWHVVTRRWDFMLNPTDKQLLPLSPRTVVPRAAFGDIQWWTIAALLAAASALFARRWTRVLTFVSLGFAFAVAWFAVVAHTSGIEHGRHAITVAIAMRLLCVIAIVHVVEALTSQRMYRGGNG